LNGLGLPLRPVCLSVFPVMLFIAFSSEKLLNAVF
jgi:hypothetical protein